MAGDFVHEDPGGDGGVEAADGAGDGDGNGQIAVGEDFGGDAGAFVANDQGEGALEVGLWEGGGGVFAGGDDADAVVLKVTQFAGEVVGAGDGEMIDRARAGTGDLAGDADLAVLRDEDTGGGEAIGDAEDGAEVKGVLEVVGNDQSGLCLREEFRGGGVGERRHFGDGALMVGGAAALRETGGRFPFDGDARGLGKGGEFLLIRFAGEVQDMGTPTPGAEGLAEEVATPNPGTLVRTEERLGHFFVAEING